MAQTNLNAVREVLVQAANELISEKLPIGYCPKDVEFKIEPSSHNVRVKVNLYPLVFELNSGRGEI